MSEPTKLEYTCARCGNTYVSTVTPTEAEDEMDRVFGDLSTRSNYDVVCDNCYKDVLTWFANQPPEKIRELGELAQALKAGPPIGGGGKGGFS